jgi:ABC-type glycerol-3-phosphate transport system substrate-binding protein
MPYPVHKQQLKWMEKLAAERGIEIKRAPIACEHYAQEVAMHLTREDPPVDVIWHNDDWGEMYAKLLEPIDDIPNFKYVSPTLYEGVFPDKIPFKPGNYRITGLPFTTTSAVLFYRKDLAPTPPKTWNELIKLSESLIKQGKIKFGVLGGTVYPHLWGTLIWSICSNGAMIFEPGGGICDTATLASYGFTPMVDDPRFQAAVEFWWDNIYTYKISPKEMIGYTRTDTDAIFKEGNSFAVWQDSIMYGTYNDPQQSKVAGNVSVMPFPAGPQGARASWDICWAWGIPKNMADERKQVAKELLNYLISDEVQIDLWNVTGGPPVTVTTRKLLYETDPLFKVVADATIYTDLVWESGGFYFAEWPKVMMTVGEYFQNMMKGKREDIPKALAALKKEINEIVEPTRERWGVQFVK